jgi:hypothetical protein
MGAEEYKSANAPTSSFKVTEAIMSSDDEVKVPAHEEILENS